MHADFSSAAKAAKAYIDVPPLDIDAIRDRSRAAGLAARLRARLAAIAIALGVLGTAAAFAANAGGVRVWLIGNKVEGIVQSFAQVREPMAPDVRKIVRDATFPVVLPSGLPSDARVLWIAYSPAQHPDMLTIQFRNAVGKPFMSVSLIDDGKLRADNASTPGGPSQAVVTHGEHWRVGGETVLLQSRHLTRGDVARIKSAMQQGSASAAAAAFDAFLPRIMVLTVTPRVADAAQRVAPAGNSVVFGKWEIRQIPRLAASGKPLRDSRTVYLTNIPQIHGRPDYRNATLFWPKSIALSADAVRAVAAAMRRTGTATGCNCAILVHAGADGYTVWKIDEKSLTATRL